MFISRFELIDIFKEGTTMGYIYLLSYLLNKSFELEIVKF